MVEEEGSQEISEYNEASFQILRLHNLWEDCNKLSAEGRLMEWNWKLDCVWRELSSDAKRIKPEFHLSEMEKINQKIMINRGSEGRLYSVLMEKEIFLRKLQDDVGKGSRRSAIDTSPL